MNLQRFLLVILIIIIGTMIGCSNSPNNSKNQGYNATQYYMIENGTLIYYNDANFITYIPEFYSIIDKTIKSFNEVKEGKRNLDFVNTIASKELIENQKYKFILETIPKDTELKVTKAIVLDYSILTLIHNKDENSIKVHITIETEEENKNGTVLVKNNQTYIYHLHNNKVELLDYHLEQHIE